MIDDSISQAEKRSVLHNDAREQSNTMHGRAMADSSIETGRFTAVNAAHVVGSEAAVKYPACSPALAVQLPDEPPLGFDNPALDETSAVSPSAAEDTGGAPSAPPDVEAPPPSPEEQGNG